MEYWTSMDWGKVFLPTMSLPEAIVRGTFVYLSVVLLFRVVLKRQAGKVALSDIFVVTIVAGVARNPLIGDAYSIADGLTIIATVLGWSYFLDWVSYHFPPLHELLHPPAVLLIQDGQCMHKNLRSELITKKQITSQLRKHGIDDVAKVHEAWLEGDGRVTVIKRTGQSR